MSDETVRGVIDHHEQRRGHHHGHHHGHSHAHGPADFGRVFAVAIGLNLLYVAGEVVFGLVAHSLALLADAGHNLGDVLALGAAWLAGRLSRVRPSARFTYGLRSSSILASVANAVALLVITGAIAAEAIRRLFDPAHVAGPVVIAVAAAGIVINGATALLFLRGRKDDLNLRAAFAHMATDALVAFGVVVAGAVILWTGWAWVDPVSSLVVSAVILVGTWSLLRDSLGYALDAVPPGIDPGAVERFLAGLPGVEAVHDLHIWGMSTTETALTAHLVRPGAPTDDALLKQAADLLRREHGIGHATLQIEHGDPAHPCALCSAETV